MQLTFARYITSHRLPAAQPHPRHLPLGGIGLLGLEIVDDAQTDALHVRSVDQGGRYGMPGLLGLAAPLKDLH